MDVEFPVESIRGKFCGGAETRRDAANEGMDVDNRLAALDGIGMGVALGDLAGVALDGALDLELIAELAVETELERAVDRENRVDVSDGAVEDVRGGIPPTFSVSKGWSQNASVLLTQWKVCKPCSCMTLPVKEFITRVNTHLTERQTGIECC